MDEETPLSQQKQVSFFHANKNSQLAAIFTFLAQLLKGLLEYRTAAAARTSMRRMIFKKVLELDAGGIEKIGPVSAITASVDAVEQMQTYFSSYLPSLIYSVLAPIYLFFHLKDISLPVAALVGLSGCGKSTILPAASSVLCANGGRDPHQWDSTGKNQFPGASSAHYFSGAAPSPDVTGS